jgi:hypothetical protein
MATYTVSQDGTGADYSLAQHNADTPGLSAGDTVSFVGTITGQIVPPVSGSSGSPIVYRDLVHNSGGATANALHLNARSHITFQDFDISQATEQGILIQGANIVTLRFNNGIIDNIAGTADAIGNGVGCTIDNRGITSLPASDIIFTNVRASNCGRMGFDTQTTGHHVYWLGCSARLCGGNYDGGGFYAHPYRQIQTTWSLVSGTIYSTAALSVNDDVQRVYDPSNTQFLTETGSTTPANGEFYYDSTLGLRINIGADPNGVQIQYARGPQRNFYWIDCVGSNNKVETSTNTHGTGLQLDDLCSESYVYGGVFANNEGAGINLFRGQSNTICGVHVYSNSSQGNSSSGNGIQANQQDGTLIANYLSHDNQGDNVAIGNGTCDLHNGVTIGAQNYGIEVISGTCNADKVWNYNNTKGATNTLSGGTLNVTNGSTADPEYNTDYTIERSSPLVGAGSKWWTGPNPTGYYREPFSDLHTDAGHYQTDYGPFHPRNI